LVSPNHSALFGWSGDNTANCFAKVRGSADTLTDLWAIVMQASPGEAALFCLQRRSNYYEGYAVRKGHTVTTYGQRAGVPGGSESINAGTMRIGATYATGAANCWKDGLGEFALWNDRSLSTSQLTALAAGAQPNAANSGGDPLIHFPFRSGDVASEANLGTGGATYDTTRVSSGYTTTTDFFLLGGSHNQQVTTLGVG
jgi:hypothetical protein